MTLLAGLLAGCGGDSTNNPTAPTGGGANFLMIDCDTSGVCNAHVGSHSPPGDVTAEAEWTSVDSSIVRILSPGRLQAVRTGDTFVKVTWHSSYGQQTVSVLPGTTPLPTYFIWGDAFETGKAPGTGLLDGVVIEILTGPLAGRRTVTGRPQSAPPGFSTGEPSPGRYTLYGIPPGVHRLRALKTGFRTQETEVSFKSSTPQASFEMVPVS
jgi:hypothetical protein